MHTAHSVKLLYRTSDIVTDTAHHFNESGNDGSGGSSSTSTSHSGMPGGKHSVERVADINADATPSQDGDRKEEKSTTQLQILSLDEQNTATDSQVARSDSPAELTTTPPPPEVHESTTKKEIIKDMNIVLFYADDWT